MKQKEVVTSHPLPTVEEIIKMMKKGMTQSQIAQKYKVTRQAVNNKLRRDTTKD